MHGGSMISELHQLVAVVAIAISAGVMAEMLLQTGVHSRGLPVLAGLFGLYVGHWLFEVTGMPVGPMIGGYPILPAWVGAFGFCAFAKLASLGVAGPRW